MLSCFKKLIAGSLLLVSLANGAADADIEQVRQDIKKADEIDSTEALRKDVDEMNAKMESKRQLYADGHAEPCDEDDGRYSPPARYPPQPVHYSPPPARYQPPPVHYAPPPARYPAPRNYAPPPAKQDPCGGSCEPHHDDCITGGSNILRHEYRVCSHHKCGECTSNQDCIDEYPNHLHLQFCGGRGTALFATAGTCGPECVMDCDCEAILAPATNAACYIGKCIVTGSFSAGGNGAGYGY